MQEPDEHRDSLHLVEVLSILSVLASVFTGSTVPVLSAALLLTVRYLHARGVYSLGATVVLFWLGWAVIRPIRVLEYGRDASVFDPVYALVMLPVLVASVLTSLALGMRELGRRNYLSGSCAIAAIPTSFLASRVLDNYLSNALNVYYK